MTSMNTNMDGHIDEEKVYLNENNFKNSKNPE
jgi:hypothetical protein